MIIAELDLENVEHLELTNAQWRYADGLVPGEPNGGLVNLMKDSPARLADYDDSNWGICENIQEIVLEGLCFGWYRITVTLPEEVDGVSVAGSQVWFHTCIDDYGEVWVDGEIDLAFGESRPRCCLRFQYAATRRCYGKRGTRGETCPCMFGY